MHAQDIFAATHDVDFHHRGLHCTTHSQLQGLPAPDGDVDPGIKLDDCIWSEVYVELCIPSHGNNSMYWADSKAREWVWIKHLTGKGSRIKFS